MCDFLCSFSGYLNKIAAYLLSDKRLVYELILDFAHMFYDIRETDEYDG